MPSTKPRDPRISPTAGAEAAATMTGLAGSTEVLRLDLADLQSVRDFVAEFTAKHDRLDGLACNAGMLNFGDLKRTKDGFESTIGVSYFGHFLLTELLLDTLKATPDARMAIVSSVMHAGRPNNRPAVDLDDIHYEAREFNGSQAYSEAKVASVLYAKELAERLEGSGVSVFSVHPGAARSNFPTMRRPTRAPTSARAASSTATRSVATVAGPWRAPTPTPKTWTLPVGSLT